MTYDSTNLPVSRLSPVRLRARDSDGLHKRRAIWHYKLKIEGRWREFSAKTKDYREAKKIRQKALQAQEEGRLPTDAARMKLSQAIPPWLEERRRLRAANTWKVERHLVKPILKALGGKRLCDITSDDIRGYQLKRVGEVSAKTVNREMRIVRAVLHRRKLWGRLADDYQSLAEQSRGPGRALSDDEERRLFEKAASRPGWQAAYYASLLAANTTARGCELRGLRLEDADLIEGVIRVRRISTKTDAGCRVIPLNGTAKWAAARLLERAQAFGATEAGHYLFPACESHRIDVTRPQTTWRTAWRNLTKEAGLKGLRFHDLRHHGITKLAEAGVPDQTLMAIAGHVSREMLEHYSHIRQKAKREAVEAIDSYRPAESIADDSAAGSVN
jgi:integrase